MDTIEARVEFLETENRRLAEIVAKLTEDSSEPDGPRAVFAQISDLQEDITSLENSELVHQIVLQELVARLSVMSPSFKNDLEARFNITNSEIDEDRADMPKGSPSHLDFVNKFEEIAGE